MDTAASVAAVAAPVHSSADVRSATRATYAAFIGSGFAFASWASRIPQVRGHLQLSASELGLVLLALASGSVVSLPVAGAVVDRLTARVTVRATSALLAAALVVVGVGYQVGVAMVVVGLFLLGFANGAWDVAMNVQGADVERQLGRAIMPRFHAGFSLGTVAGALLGAGMVALDVSVTLHLAAVAVVVVAVVPRAARAFLPDAGAHPGGDTPPAPGALARWREPRTLVVGVLVLAFAFSEGTGNDWITIALIDGHHTSAVVGTLGYAVFLAAMTAARWAGQGLLGRFGRVPVVRALACLALVGLLLFVLGPGLWLALLGVLLWGTGTSLGFPVGMSAAADEPAAAAGRVSVVASVGYCAFLGGPPLIGFLGSQTGVLHALAAVGVLLAVATATAGALRPLHAGAPGTDPS